MLVDTHREAVRPVLPDLLTEYEAGNDDTRGVAADLLCTLATHPEDGAAVIEAMIRWLGTHPRTPREHHRWHSRTEPLFDPSLTDNPPSGVLGVAQVLARIAEEAPSAVVPHCEDIVASLTAWESTQADKWPRGYLARALAAVAQQWPQTATSMAEDVLTVLADDLDVVRYWAAQTLLALYPYQPDTISPAVIRDVLTDANPDVRGVGVDLAKGCIADGVVEIDASALPDGV